MSDECTCINGVNNTKCRSEPSHSSSKGKCVSLTPLKRRSSSTGFPMRND